MHQRNMRYHRSWKIAQDLSVVKEALSKLVQGLLGRFNKANRRPPHLDPEPTLPERQIQESIYGCEETTAIIQDLIREDLARTPRIPSAEMGYQARSNRALSVTSSQSRNLKSSSAETHRKYALVDRSTVATPIVLHQPVGLSFRCPVLEAIFNALYQDSHSILSCAQSVTTTSAALLS